MGKRRKSKTRREKKRHVRTEYQKYNSHDQQKLEKKEAKLPTKTLIKLSSGDLIGSNEDLLRNVLICVVSDKSLSAFKSVSKLWLSVISDPDFTLRWHTKHLPSPSALIFEPYYKLRDIAFIPLDEREKNLVSPSSSNFHSPPSSDFNWYSRRILQSCNGLLLVEGFYPSHLNVAVFNPTTNQLKSTPKVLNEEYISTNPCALVFDPWKSPHYKVILFTEAYYKYSAAVIYIYESEMDLWRAVSVGKDSLFYTIAYDDAVMFDSGVYWNGGIHWPSRKRRSSIYFDVEKECAMMMPMPPIQGRQNERNIRYFGESGGHLLLIDYEDDFAMRFDVFEMESDRSNWSVKYIVNLIGLPLRFYALGLPIHPIHRFSSSFLTIIVNGDKGRGEQESPLLVMYVPYNKMVISYNLKNKKVKNLCHLSPYNLRGFHPFIRLPTIVL